MDIASLYEEIQTPLGLRTRIAIEEIAPPAPVAQIEDFGEVSIFGERPIDLLLQRQDMPTIPDPVIEVIESDLLTMPSATDASVAA